MLSNPQFGSSSMTQSKQAIPETGKFDGPAGLESSGSENKFAANTTKPLAKPGFNS